MSLRAELEPLPPRIAKLPVHRGYPVPWFVEWVDDNGGAALRGLGTPDFRIMSRIRWQQAVLERRCWVCGERISAYMAFTIGPMCAVNRISAEPPSHRECAEWSARNCPFLARPHMRRREVGKPENAVQAPGVALMRNPGVALVWVTRKYTLKRDGEGGHLFNIGEPHDVSWWAQGRPATREEIERSIDTGLPALRELAQEDGERAVRELEAMVVRARELLPA
jgi:hypothetical protein